MMTLKTTNIFILTIFKNSTVTTTVLFRDMMSIVTQHYLHYCSTEHIGHRRQAPILLKHEFGWSLFQF
jgi:hypothetical protein